MVSVCETWKMSIGTQYHLSYKAFRRPPSGIRLLEVDRLLRSLISGIEKIIVDLDEDVRNFSRYIKIRLDENNSHNNKTRLKKLVLIWLLKRLKVQKKRWLRVHGSVISSWRRHRFMKYGIWFTVMEHNIQSRIWTWWPNWIEYWTFFCVEYIRTWCYGFQNCS